MRQLIGYWRVWVVALGAVGMLWAVLTWFIDSGDKVGAPYLVVSLSVAFWIIIILFELLMKEKNIKGLSMPKARSCVYRKNKNEIRIVMNSSEHFNIGVIVSIFYIDDGVEKLIGGGLVENIQENGFIVILVRVCFDDFKENWDNIKTNNATDLRRLIVKPYVMNELLSHQF